MNRRLLTVLLPLLLTACVDEVSLPIRQMESRLVVDGLITTDPAPLCGQTDVYGAV